MTKLRNLMLVAVSGGALMAFGLTTISLIWLSIVVTNNWETLPTIIGLIVFGIGQGSLVTLLFNVLVTASPKVLAGDVGSLRGTTQNLAAAVGTAVAGALLVGLLSAIALGKITASPVLTKELQSQVDLDNITFVSNDRLRSVLEAMSLRRFLVDQGLAASVQRAVVTCPAGISGAAVERVAPSAATASALSE